MKICLVPDVHLFSSKIGGNWSEDSFTIFTEKFLPRIKQEKPGMTVFLGDTLDPGNLKWDEGDKKGILFANAIRSIKMEHMYSLLGNHEQRAPLEAISKMGGPEFVDNRWIDIGDIGFYFFSTRYEDRHNMEKVIGDLRLIKERHDVKTKILFMHDGLSIVGKKDGNIPKEIMIETSKKFDAIFNGHQHFYEEYLKNKIWCLDSALPWRITRKSKKDIDPNQANIDDAWECDPESPTSLYDGTDLKIVKNKYRDRYGFYIFDTDTRKLDPIHIDIGIDIVNIRLKYDNVSASHVSNQLVEIYGKLENDKQKTIVRLYIEGSLREGENIDFDTIKNDYYYKFYEGKSENIINTKKLKIIDVDDLDEENLTNFVSMEAALETLEHRRPYIKKKWEDDVGKVKPLQQLMMLKTLLKDNDGFERLLNKLRLLKPKYYDVLKVRKHEN